MISNLNNALLINSLYYLQQPTGIAAHRILIEECLYFLSLMQAKKYFQIGNLIDQFRLVSLIFLR